MRQESLNFDAQTPNAIVALARYDWRLCSPPCAYGITVSWTGPHHCPICSIAVEHDCEEFAAMVKSGHYNERGFTPAEWKAKLKRDAK